MLRVINSLTTYCLGEWKNLGEQMKQKYEPLTKDKEELMYNAEYGCFNQDVKSAVMWLMNRIEKNEIGCDLELNEDNIFGFNQCRKNIIKRLKQAFPIFFK